MIEAADSSTHHENYIYLKETGLVFSSSVLSQRLRQPPSTKPVPFSKVYVCDFELDFISKDDTDVLFTPIRDLKAKVRDLQEDQNSIVSQYEKIQESESEALMRAQETKRALMSE